LFLERVVQVKQRVLSTWFDISCTCVRKKIWTYKKESSRYSIDMVLQRNRE